MNTFLDLLIIVVMAIVAVGVISTALMFLVKNDRVKRICFWLVSALGLYMGYVGIRILWPEFMLGGAVAVIMALMSVAAVVLERTGKDDEKKFLAARIMSSAALFIGMYNALFI